MESLLINDLRFADSGIQSTYLIFRIDLFGGPCDLHCTIIAYPVRLVALIQFHPTLPTCYLLPCEYVWPIGILIDSILLQFLGSRSPISFSSVY